MIEFVLVRHAQPDWEPNGRAVDHPALSAWGRKQALATADALAQEPPFDVFYVSTLRRALETAEPIAERLGLPFKSVSWLDELRLPTLEGRTSGEVEAFFRGQRARDLESWWEGTDDGESFRHLHERVTAGIEELLKGPHGMSEHQNTGHRIWRPVDREERILIVAHEGTIAVILSFLLGTSPVPWEFVRFASAWTGLHTVGTVPVADGCVFALRSFNQTRHLLPLGPPPGGRVG